MKAKSNRLKLAVPMSWLGREEVAALSSAGHEVIYLEDLDNVDICLGPVAHYWPDRFWDKPKLIDVAMKWARRKKKEKVA